MIPRIARQKIEVALARQAAVALIGPRQVGKTTLALEIAGTRPSIYLDLEATADRDKLSDPALFLDRHADKLVILALSAPIWSAMCRCSDHVSRQRPLGVFGPCWRTTKAPRSTHHAWRPA